MEPGDNLFHKLFANSNSHLLSRGDGPALKDPGEGTGDVSRRRAEARAVELRAVGADNVHRDSRVFDEPFARLPRFLGDPGRRTFRRRDRSMVTIAVGSR